MSASQRSPPRVLQTSGGRFGADWAHSPEVLPGIRLVRHGGSARAIQEVSGGGRRGGAAHRPVRGNGFLTVLANRCLTPIHPWRCRRSRVRSLGIPRTACRLPSRTASVLRRVERGPGCPRRSKRSPVAPPRADPERAHAPSGSPGRRSSHGSCLDTGARLAGVAAGLAKTSWSGCRVGTAWVLQGEPLDPCSLASGLDRPRSVVGSHPRDRLGNWDAGQGRHAGQHRPGPSAPTATGNLDAPARLSSPERLVDGERRLLSVGRRAEIGPDNPVRLPAGLKPTAAPKGGPPQHLPAGRALLLPGAADQVEPVVRQGTVGEWAPQAPAPDEGAIGKLGGSTQCRAHGSLPQDRFIARILAPNLCISE
jgi:hypothetical protein